MIYIVSIIIALIIGLITYIYCKIETEKESEKITPEEKERRGFEKFKEIFLRTTMPTELRKIVQESNTMEELQEKVKKCREENIEVERYFRKRENIEAERHFNNGEK